MGAGNWDWPLSVSGSDDWLDFPMPASGRSADPLSPYFVDPKVAAITDRHPSVADCMRRDAEIAEWNAAMLRYENDARRHTALQGAPPALFVAAVGLLIIGQVAASVVAALAVLAVLAWVALRRRVADPGLPPPPLRLRPYEADENRVLVARVEPTPFSSVCVCPGCGCLALHRLVSVDRVAVRKCVTCSREWSQI